MFDNVLCMYFSERVFAISVLMTKKGVLKGNMKSLDFGICLFPHIWHPYTNNTTLGQKEDTGSCTKGLQLH